MQKQIMLSLGLKTPWFDKLGERQHEVKRSLCYEMDELTPGVFEENIQVGFRFRAKSAKHGVIKDERIDNCL